jgi:hypothetical protein
MKMTQALLVAGMVAAAATLAASSGATMPTGGIVANRPAAGASGPGPRTQPRRPVFNGGLESQLVAEIR